MIQHYFLTTVIFILPHTLPRIKKSCQVRMLCIQCFINSLGQLQYLRIYVATVVAQVNYIRTYSNICPTTYSVKYQLSGVLNYRKSS